MWQRFTERARRVVFFAQEEASILGHNVVSDEHLLLGLCRENDSVARRILDRTGVQLTSIRNAVEASAFRGDDGPGGEKELSPSGKQAIDLAIDEARLFGNNYVGTEHL